MIRTMFRLLRLPGLLLALGAVLVACQDDLDPSGPIGPTAGLGFVDSVRVVSEGDSIEVWLRRSDPQVERILPVEVIAGSADSSDFLLRDVPVIFAPGEARARFLLRSVADPFEEGDEEVRLRIAPSTGAVVADESSACRIVILDAGPRPYLRWSERVPGFVEETDELQVLWVEGVNLEREQTFQVRAVGGAAVEDLDYRLIVLGGARPNGGGAVYLTLLADSIEEEDETLTLEIVSDSATVFVPAPRLDLVILDPGPAAPPSGPIRFPLDPGTQWRFARWRWTFHEVPEYDELTRTVIEEREIDGETVAIVSDDGRRWSGYRQDGAIVLAYSGLRGAAEEEIEVHRFFDFLTSEARWEFVHLDTLVGGEVYQRHEWMENGGRTAVATPAGILRDVHAFSHHEIWRDDSIPRFENRVTTYYVADDLGIVEVRSVSEGSDHARLRTREELITGP